MKKKNKATKNKSTNKTKIQLHTQRQLTWIVFTGLLMIIGLLIFKYLPIYLYGEEIQYDASLHIVFMIFALYILWFFVDQKKSWRIPYFVFSGAIIIIVSIQRIITQQHNEVGILLALIIGAASIVIPRWKEFMKGVKF